MASDDALKAFGDARVALRENARWVLGATGGLIALVIGGATFSQFGSLDFHSPRFWLAVIPGLIGFCLCAIPFLNAIRLLNIGVVSMKDFVGAKKGAHLSAYNAIQKQMGSSLPGCSIAKFVEDYDAALATANTAAAGAKIKHANKYLDDNESLYAEVGQALTTEFVSIQFKQLMYSLLGPGAAILILFVVFAWAANPPKDAHTLVTTPFTRTLHPDEESIALLKPTVSDPRCYTPVARVIVVANGLGGAMDAVLVPPGPGGVSCPPMRVIVIDGQLRPVG